MFKKFQSLLGNVKGFALVNFAMLLTFIAGTGISANCWWTTYEPDIPECLKK